MNRTFTLCFSLYPIALPFGYVLIYTFYHYAVPDANSNLASGNYSGPGTINTDWVASGTCGYTVRNNICFARFDVTLKQITSNRTVILSGFPKPQYNTLGTISQWSYQQPHICASIEITPDGQIVCNVAPAQYLAGYLVYPVS